MGLDMYLYKKHDTKNHRFEQRQTAVSVATNGVPRTDIKPERIQHVTELVGYWRKVNAIHGWFVHNVMNGKNENCTDFTVKRAQIEALRDTCKRVIATPSLAAELLPAYVGFFYGAYEYDEDYFADLADAVADLDQVLAEPTPFPDTFDYVYAASW
jgi:hypothetical protein